jgi:hypothetical protein
MTMPALIFENNGWTVVTSAWSYGYYPLDKLIRVSYLWDERSEPITATDAVEIPIALDAFLRLLQSSGTSLDLRPYQKKK